MVVVVHLRRLTPRKPFSDIRRATGLRPMCVPSNANSAWICGAPWVPRDDSGSRVTKSEFPTRSTTDPIPIHQRLGGRVWPQWHVAGPMDQPLIINPWERFARYIERAADSTWGCAFLNRVPIAFLQFLLAICVKRAYNVHELNTLEGTEHEFLVLENIYHYPLEKPVKQRDLAQILGISLGMTNVIIRRLAQRGWVNAQKVNSRSIKYAITPLGLEQITMRSLRLIKKTVRSVVYYKDMLEEFVKREKEGGSSGILLLGKSDFDFILAHLCHLYGMRFMNAKTADTDARMTVVCSEDMGYLRRQTQGEPRVFLSEILIGP